MNALSEFLHSMGGDAPYDLEEYTRKVSYPMSAAIGTYSLSFSSISALCLRACR